jgi:hypothetical protein
LGRSAVHDDGAKRGCMTELVHIFTTTARAAKCLNTDAVLTQRAPGKKVPGRLEPFCFARVIVSWGRV